MICIQERGSYNSLHSSGGPGWGSLWFPIQRSEISPGFPSVGGFEDRLWSYCPTILCVKHFELRKIGERRGGACRRCMIRSAPNNRRVTTPPTKCTHEQWSDHDQ